MGGSVFTDRDYSEGIKSKFVKNSIIFLGLSPLLVIIVLLWRMDLQVFSLIAAFAIALVSAFAFFVTKSSL